MIKKTTYYAFVFLFIIVFSACAQDKNSNFNGIYQLTSEGKEFKLRNDSLKIYKIDSTVFVSINTFKNIKTSLDLSSMSTINIELNDIGKGQFLTLTKNNMGKPLAFIINNVLYMAPIVNSAIPNGQFEISGLNNVEESERLKRLIEVIKKREQN